MFFDCRLPGQPLSVDRAFPGIGVPFGLPRSKTLGLIVELKKSIEARKGKGQVHFGNSPALPKGAVLPCVPFNPRKTDAQGLEAGPDCLSLAVRLEAVPFPISGR